MAEQTGREEGQQVRRRRVRLGLTVRQVAAATGVDEAFVRALEEGTPGRRAPSPGYELAWRRTVERFLDRAETKVARGLRWDATTSSPSTSGAHPRLPTPDGGETDPRIAHVAVQPVPVVDPGLGRAYARLRLGTVLALASSVVVLGVWAGHLIRYRQSQPVPGPDPIEVQVRVQVPQQLVVAVDGAVVLDRKVGRGERLRWVAREDVSVDAVDPFGLRVTYAGQTVQPRGHRNRPRRMVFVAAAEGGP